MLSSPRERNGMVNLERDEFGLVSDIRHSIS